LRCDDDRLYVVKFQGNPQGTKILAHEWIATRLAGLLGLAVSPCEVVELTAEFSVRSTELIAAGSETGCHYSPGLHFGSEYLAGATEVFPQIDAIRNVSAYAGMLAFDTWTGQVDHRQAIFERVNDWHIATFVDFGYAFMASGWPTTMRSSQSMFGLCNRTAVYASIRGWQDLEPWLSNIERLGHASLRYATSGMPPAWLAETEVRSIVTGLTFLQGQLRHRLSLMLDNAEVFPSWGESFRIAA
jgi:hypothetical protein